MVEGLAALQARFRSLPKQVQAAARKTLEQNAAEVVATMQRLVPVESGALRASIGWTWGAPPAGAKVLGTVANSEGSDFSITIYAGDGKAFYALYQEFGTKNMTANPFFWPAVRVNRTRGRSRMARNVRKAAEQAFNG